MQQIDKETEYIWCTTSFTEQYKLALIGPKEKWKSPVHTGQYEPFISFRGPHTVLLSLVFKKKKKKKLKTSQPSQFIRYCPTGCLLTSICSLILPVSCFKTLYWSNHSTLPSVCSPFWCCPLGPSMKWSWRERFNQRTTGKLSLTLPPSHNVRCHQSSPTSSSWPGEESCLEGRSKLIIELTFCISACPPISCQLDWRIEEKKKHRLVYFNSFLKSHQLIVIGCIQHCCFVGGKRLL